MDQAIDLGPMNWVPLKQGFSACADVGEMRRVQDVFVSVNVRESSIGVNYLMRNGDALDRFLRI